MKQFNFLFTLLLLLSFAACNSDKNKYPKGYEEGDEYFSTVDFFKDQWKSRDNYTYVFAKVTKVNGVVTDSTIVNWSETLFAEIAAPFEKADISDPKFLGKYNIDFIKEEDNTVMYTANDEDLYTQKIILTFDGENSKVRSLYIETREDGLMNMDKKNLLYLPDNTTQFVEFKKAAMSKSEQIITTYKFL